MILINILYKGVFMIILLHGTGDDSSKAEHWIPYVADIMKSYGESVLVVAGCGTGVMDENAHDEGQSKIAPEALAFIASLKESGCSNTNKSLGVNANNFRCQGLIDALNAAGGDQFPLTAMVHVGQEEILIERLKKEKKADGPKVGTGIKYRAAIASICAIAYKRRIKDLRPIRIIGHSRGGSTAVAIHNILTYHGYICSTLTLDPCHGKAKFFEKDYYKKIWAGELVNLPCNKNVAQDWFPDFLMCRPPITLGSDFNAGAVIRQYIRLMHIKHGHMGKLKDFKKDKEGKGSKIKFKEEIDVWIDNKLKEEKGKSKSAQKFLIDFFRKFIGERQSPIGKDKSIIAYYVIELLTGTIPPENLTEPDTII